LIAIGIGGGYLLSSYFYSNEALTDVASLRGGETRPTLSPARFTGKTASTYRFYPSNKNYLGFFITSFSS